MTKTEPGYPVAGWQLNNSMELAVLKFGIPGTDLNGEPGIGPSPNFLLTPQHCRELAADLLQIADRIEGHVGTA